MSPLDQRKYLSFLLCVTMIGCSSDSNKSIQNQDAFEAISASGKYTNSKICLKLEEKLPILLPSDDPAATSKVNALAVAGLVDIRKAKKIGNVFDVTSQPILLEGIEATRSQANAAILAGADPLFVKARLLEFVNKNYPSKRISAELDDAGIARVSKKGKEFISDDERSFCFLGKPLSMHIVFATTPTKTADLITSMAVYEYTLDEKSIPEWATNPSVVFAFPEINKEHKTIRDREVLVSTTNGWVTASSLSTTR